jgi:hypothetical protein
MVRTKCIPRYSFNHKPRRTLDLDFISQEIPKPENNRKALEWLGDWLDQAHERIEEAFISSLNPSYYESLK